MGNKQKSKNAPKFSIVIPCYNEEKVIEKTLDKIDEWYKKQDFEIEVLAVDNNSSDRTMEMIGEKIKKRDYISILVEKCQGKGCAVRNGMLIANGEYILFMDADNSTDISHMDKMWSFFKKGYDVVIGSIEVPGAEVYEETGWYKRLFGHWSKLLIRLIALPGIYDSQRGFKCFTKKAVYDIFSKQRIEKWGFDIEILAIARKLGYKIKEMPVKWVNVGKSEVKPSAYIKTLLELFQIKWNLITGKYK
ncbi:hypothetical protein COY23_00815 [bacterium (Candidatus Torokbacteria) CG_4_10_14_0_2_um_filter_35_8]|nr:MAG: hypothetical protein COY23_00815 [bacterium (Candidatus Torokbacteria) CG_4_10_14_0_2_um_filter_35_8]